MPLSINSPMPAGSATSPLVLASARCGFARSCGLRVVGRETVPGTRKQTLESGNETFGGSVSGSTSTVLPVTPSATAEVQRVKAAPGSAIGRIEISRIGVDVIIAEGTDGKTLRRGVGHVTGTSLPGEPGNVAIAGHRDTFFRALRNVQQGDEVTLTTVDGAFHYRVDWTTVVGDEATEVLSDSDEAILTLVTCYPFYFVGPAPKRFIVRAHKL